MNEDKTNEIRAGLLQGAGIAALALALAAPVAWWTSAATPEAPAPLPSATAPAALPHRADFGDVAAPSDVRTVAGWAVSGRDHGRSSFAVIDKRRAHLYVFDAQGRLRGDTPVLLGYAAGDDSAPGIGQRPIDQVRPQERTTPAGRFEAGSGRNLLNEDVIWVDYAAAVSMHRVRATDPRERRLERLATPTTADNRISYGCINVPVAFFDSVVWPALGGHPVVVYVLPEVKTLDQVFPQAAAWAASRMARASVPLV
jgi:hypothetical protein